MSSVCRMQSYQYYCWVTKYLATGFKSELGKLTYRSKPAKLHQCPACRIRYSDNPLSSAEIAASVRGIGLGFNPRYRAWLVMFSRARCSKS